jgi:hypothetical protein
MCSQLLGRPLGSGASGARLLLVSDLHLAAAGGPYPDPLADDIAIAATLEWFAAQLAQSTRLVVLGDLLDFVLAPPHLRAGAAADDLAAVKLEAIAASHPRVFAALGAFASAGHSLEVVPGNHDVELLRPPIQSRLRALLGDAQVAFHPWMLHVPGVLYAEHGQQHTVANHFVGLLNRSTASAAGDPPAPARLLDDLDALLASRLGFPAQNLELWAGTGRALLAREPGAAGAALAAAAGLCRLARSCAALAHAGKDEHVTGSLVETAGELRLPVEALVAITNRSRPTVRAAARSIGRASLARRPGPRSHGLAAPCPSPGPDRAMLEAAREVDAVLREHGVGVPFYAFGHTHLARDVPLAVGLSGPGAGSRPRYLNPGTWSTLARPGRESAADRQRLIEIAYEHPGPPRARWWRWDADAGRPALLAGQSRR